MIGTGDDALPFAAERHAFVGVQTRPPVGIQFLVFGAGQCVHRGFDAAPGICGEDAADTLRRHRHIGIEADAGAQTEFVFRADGEHYGGGTHGMSDQGGEQIFTAAFLPSQRGLDVGKAATVGGRIGNQGRKPRFDIEARNFCTQGRTSAFGVADHNRPPAFALHEFAEIGQTLLGATGTMADDDRAQTGADRCVMQSRRFGAIAARQ